MTWMSRPQVHPDEAIAAARLLRKTVFLTGVNRGQYRRPSRNGAWFRGALQANVLSSLWNAWDSPSCWFYSPERCFHSGLRSPSPARRRFARLTS